MNNVTQLSDCYGCGTCVIACPKKIIHMELNEEGFYSPRIHDTTACIECGLCLAVCGYLSDLPDDGRRQKPESYAAWSKNEQTRLQCSSGGIGYEISRKLLAQGYKVCTCRYNVSEKRAEHYIAEEEKELQSSKGSKYIPSYTCSGFKYLNRTGKFLVIGTPCQIDGIRRYIRKFKCEDNFVLVDFFCHGVPSMWMWYKYLSMKEKQWGEITHASWRNKTTGWHDSWSMGIQGKGNRQKGCANSTNKEEVIYSRWTQGDLFYKFFLGNICFRSSCYDNCKYKMTNSSADIRIGDLWGKKYATDFNGVSAVLSFSEQGDVVLSSLSNTVELTKESLETALEGQMKQAAKRPRLQKYVMSRLKSSESLPIIASKTRFYTELLSLHTMPFRLIRKLLRQLKKH